jgi:hypothetical protein
VSGATGLPGLPAAGREEHPICPNGSHKGTWPRGAPGLDRYTDGSGWSCPGLKPDGSACGYELRLGAAPHGRRVHADRALYVSALADAIDWTESFLATHDGERVSGLGHCDGPGGRCEAYRKDAAKLARYRQAYTRITGHRADGGEPGTTVTLAELSARGDTPPRAGD